MPSAGAMSVATFSVVLAEVFTAVGLSSLIPATWVEIARVLRRLGPQPGGGPGPDGLSADEIAKALATVARLVPIPAGDDGTTAVAAKVIQALLASSDTIDLLLPKTASIDATFKFEAKEALDVQEQVGAALDVVSVRAGFSALYEEKSSNSITLKVDYVSVQEVLAPPKPPH